MKIYIASSWKNEKWVWAIAYSLREKEYEVDAFVDLSTGRYVFNWKEIVEDKNELNAISFLKDERSQKAFQEDRKWLDWCECLILILPAGKSAHLEAGYIKGQGKRLIIYHPLGFPQGEFDVMYGFADLITEDFDEILNHLKENNDPLA